MKHILKLSHQLLDLTRQLHQVVSSDQIDALDSLQDERSRLVAELDFESRQPHPIDDLADCQVLITEARSLEKEIVNQLNTLRDHIRDTHDQMSTSKQAMKAYDKFR